jgi:hypothetical protein
MLRPGTTTDHKPLTCCAGLLLTPSLEHVFLSGFSSFLPIRYEHRADIYQAFTSLAASLITLNQIKRFC